LFDQSGVGVSPVDGDIVVENLHRERDGCESDMGDKQGGVPPCSISPGSASPQCTETLWWKIFHRGDYSFQGRDAARRARSVWTDRLFGTKLVAAPLSDARRLMKRPLPFALLVWLAASMDATGQGADPARAQQAPAGGPAAGAVATPLPAEQHMGGTPEQTKLVSLAAGIAGFAAAIATGSPSANH